MVCDYEESIILTLKNRNGRRIAGRTFCRSPDHRLRAGQRVLPVSCADQRGGLHLPWRRTRGLQYLRTRYGNVLPRGRQSYGGTIPSEESYYRQTRASVESTCILSSGTFASQFPVDCISEAGESPMRHRYLPPNLHKKKELMPIKDLGSHTVNRGLAIKRNPEPFFFFCCSNPGDSRRTCIVCTVMGLNQNGHRR